MKRLINIQNKDNECFRSCLVRNLNTMEKKSIGDITYTASAVKPCKNLPSNSSHNITVTFYEESTYVRLIFNLC